jgi:hypothetical protein
MSEKVDILIPPSSIAEIMEHLKCPLCKDRTTSPVTFCEKGHNVCCTCRGSLDERATGSHQFSGIRNIKLEKISFWSNLSCPYLECGCPVMVTAELMDDHLSICVYKKATCPLNKTMSIVFPWEGLLKDVLFHCKVSHKIRFADYEFFMTKKYSFFTKDFLPVNFAALSRKWAYLRDRIQPASFWTR